MIVRLLRQVSHVLIERGTQLRPLAHDLYISRSGLQQAQEAIHRGGLAGSVLTHEGEKVTVPHFQAETVECPDALPEEASPKMHMNILATITLPPRRTVC